MRYFGGKVGLLEALFDEAWNHINVRVEKALETTAAAGNRESLLVAIQTVVTALARDLNLASLLMFEGRRIRGSAPRVRLSRGFVTYSETIHRLIRNAQTTREIDPRFDTLAVTSALLGAAESLMRDRLVAKKGGRGSFAEREIRRTLEGMLAGLRGKPRAARGAVKKR